MLDFKCCAFLRPPVKSFFSILFYHGEWISNEYLIYLLYQSTVPSLHKLGSEVVSNKRYSEYKLVVGWVVRAAGRRLQDRRVPASAAVQPSVARRPAQPSSIQHRAIKTKLNQTQTSARNEK